MVRALLKTAIAHRTLDPVEIQLPQEGEGNQIHVTNASEEYLKMSRHPAYKDSTLVQNAAVASRFIVTTSGYLANALTTGAETFTKKTKPNPKPMTFTPTTQARVRKLNSLSQGAVGLSAKTVGQVSRYAQNFGAAMAGRGTKSSKGPPPKDYKPGLLNKSMMAFSTVADGIDYASRNLLTSGSSAATTVVGHRYGDEAKKFAGEVAGGVKNVGLVYVDASGVSRRALIKSTAKGMACLLEPSHGDDQLTRPQIVGKVPGGGNLVVGAGDGGFVPPEAMDPKRSQTPVGNDKFFGEGQAGLAAPEVGQIGFGNAAAPAASSGVGEPLGTQGLQGQASKR